MTATLIVFARGSHCGVCVDGHSVGVVDCRWNDFLEHEEWTAVVDSTVGAYELLGPHHEPSVFASAQDAADAVEAELRSRVLRAALMVALRAGETRFSSLLAVAHRLGAGLPGLMAALKAMATAGEVESDGSPFHWHLVSKAGA